LSELLLFGNLEAGSTVSVIRDGDDLKLEPFDAAQGKPEK
jgi:hypothetical protein